LARNRHIANFAFRLLDSQQLSTSAYLFSQVCSTCQCPGWPETSWAPSYPISRRAVLGVDAKGVVEC
jgi:hypothetical protein